MLRCPPVMLIAMRIWQNSRAAKSFLAFHHDRIIIPRCVKTNEEWFSFCLRQARSVFCAEGSGLRAGKAGLAICSGAC